MVNHLIKNQGMIYHIIKEPKNDFPSNKKNQGMIYHLIKKNKV